MRIEITTMKECHLDEVAALEDISFSEPWSRQAFCDAVNNEEYLYLVALSEGKVVGYAGCYVVMDEGNITNIAVDNNYRRLGIGNELMKQLQQLLIQREVTNIFLEVRESNEAAKLLYTSCGYAEIGIRKNFYSKPQENAIVMKLEISGEK